MYYHYRQVHYWCIEKCPLYRGYLYCVHYSEGPLSEVPLYTVHHRGVAEEIV